MRTSPEAWVQISSGQGPLECERAVERLLSLFLTEAKASGLVTEILERVAGAGPECLASALITVSGEGLSEFLERWSGTILWTAWSPFRPYHKRKNWFVGVEVLEVPEAKAWAAHEVSFEAFRGSGPGGQNVNKVSTAVRAIHQPTGLAVVAREERSQHANRKLALARLSQLLQVQVDQATESQRQSRRLTHYQLERGDPVRRIQRPLE